MEDSNAALDYFGVNRDTASVLMKSIARSVGPGMVGSPRELRRQRMLIFVLAVLLVGLGVSVGLNVWLLLQPLKTSISNRVSLRSFSLETRSIYPSPYLSGEVFVNAGPSLSALHLFVNGTYEVSSSYSNDLTANYCLLYKATLWNDTMPIVQGRAYLILLVAVFRDNSVSAASCLVVAV